MSHKVNILLGSCLLFLLSSCYNTYNVTSYSDHYIEILNAQNELAKMGYELAGEDTRTDNNVYVSSVSYSTTSGYGTAMNNDYMTTDTYTFRNDEGNTMNYSVSYKLHRSADSILYVTNVSVPQCETSKPSEYTRLCGYGSPIRGITQVPNNTRIKEDDTVANYILGTLAGLAIGAGLLWLEVYLLGNSY